MEEKSFTADDLAKAIDLAAMLRERSYNEAEKDCELTYIEAAEKAIEKIGIDNRLSEIIKRLLTTCWNEALDWSFRVRKERGDV